VARFYAESWQRAREAGFRARDGIGERARSTTHAAAAEVGLDALELEVLEVLEVASDRTPAQVRADLEALEALWRERFGAADLY
jgi:hypothetical protein